MQVSEQRREILRKLGFLSLGTTMGGFAWGKPVDHTLHLRPIAPSKPILQKKITGIVLGAGNRGNVYGNYTDFRTGEQEKWNVHENTKLDSGHGGGDWGLLRDWLQAVDQQDANVLTSTLAASMESHLMGFMAERSRHERQVKRIML
ncbi:MAG: hypothetical protein AAFY48_15525 [Bacteroidota bacterium]